MGLEIRPATAADAASWLELTKAALGEQYPAKDLYDLKWIAQELSPGAINETWVAEANGSLRASVTFLGIEGMKTNPIANLGRLFFRPDSLSDGSAKALLQKVNELADKRGETVITRVSPLDDGHQILFEDLGYTCVGYQPIKHLLSKRTGTLFYVRGAKAVLVTRLPLSESLPQVAELCIATLESLRIVNPIVVRDGASGYPLQSDLKISNASPEDYTAGREQAQASNPPHELSGRFNMGSGHMRLPQTADARFPGGEGRQDGGRAGLLF